MHTTRTYKNILVSNCFQHIVNYIYYIHMHISYQSISHNSMRHTSPSDMTHFSNPIKNK